MRLEPVVNSDLYKPSESPVYHLFLAGGKLGATRSKIELPFLLMQFTLLMQVVYDEVR